MLFFFFLLISRIIFFFFLFFFNDTATTEIYTLSLHDALPILSRIIVHCFRYVGSISDDTHPVTCLLSPTLETGGGWGDTFLNAVFFCECLVGEILGPFLNLSNGRARIPRNTHPCDNTSKGLGAAMGRRY